MKITPAVASVVFRQFWYFYAVSALWLGLAFGPFSSSPNQVVAVSVRTLAVLYVVFVTIVLALRGHKIPEISDYQEVGPTDTLHFWKIASCGLFKILQVLTLSSLCWFALWWLFRYIVPCIGRLDVFFYASSAFIGVISFMTLYSFAYRWNLPVTKWASVPLCFQGLLMLWLLGTPILMSVFGTVRKYPGFGMDIHKDGMTISKRSPLAKDAISLKHNHAQVKGYTGTVYSIQELRDELTTQGHLVIVNSELLLVELAPDVYADLSDAIRQVRLGRYKRNMLIVLAFLSLYLVFDLVVVFSLNRNLGVAANQETWQMPLRDFCRVFQYLDLPAFSAYIGIVYLFFAMLKEGIPGFADFIAGAACMQMILSSMIYLYAFPDYIVPGIVATEILHRECVTCNLDAKSRKELESTLE